MEKNCFKEFIRYVTLNVLGMFGFSCYILADTFFISKGMGSDGLTALNLIIPVYNLMNGTGLMLGMGGASRYAILKGQGQEKKGSQVFTHTVVMTVFFALFYMLVGIFLPEKLSLLLGATGEVFSMCRIYLRVMLLFSPLFMMNSVMQCFVRNDGAPQLSTASMLVGSFSNIILDYVLVIRLRWGMFGAVFATGLSPVVGLCILSVFFFKKKNNFHLVHCRPEKRTAGYIMGGGASSLVAELSSGIVILIFNMILLKLEGNLAVAAYGVIANLSLVMTAVFTGIGQGSQPLVSRYYGMGETENIKKILRYGVVLTAALSVLTYAGLCIARTETVRIFNSEGNAVLQEIAEKGMVLYFLGAFPAGLNIFLALYSMASDRAGKANLISMLRGFLLIIPFAFLLSWMFGMTGLWLTFPATEIVTTAAAIFILKRKRE